MKYVRGLPLELENRLGFGKKEIDSLLLFLTPSCNYDCKMCYVEKKRKFESGLSLEERTEIITKAKEMGAKSIIIPGEGEPLIDKQFKDIISFNYGLGLTSVVYTNGYFLSKELAEFAQKNDISFIVNIPTLVEKLYEDITNKKNSFAIVMRNIKHLRETYGKASERLAINMVLLEETKYGTDQVKEFCGNDFIFICSYPVKEGTAIKNWDALGDIEELREISKNKSDLKGQTMSSKGYCAFRDHGLTITFDGKILPCPASWETYNLIGDTKKTRLEVLHKRVKTNLNSFFKEYGFSPCLVRHKDYKEFIKKLR